MITELYGVSLIICCYNSALRLPDTLKHIALQNVPDSILWEVIIVNNNSTDDTEMVAVSEWQKYRLSIPFRVVYEPRAGLSFARKKGVASANFDLLLFCDDDNWLDENYLLNACRIMNSKSNVGILGGRSTAVFETEKPGWFDKFQHAYAVGNQLTTSGIANERTFIAGAGMIVRREIFRLLDDLDFEFRLTGRVGKALSSGEDSELCLVAMFLGYDIYYDERLIFLHYMPAVRLSWKYCVSMVACGHAIPQIYFDFYNYCYQKILSGQKAEFDDALMSARKKITKKIMSILVHTRPFWLPFSLLIRSQHGSRKEIELKAAINKLIYLFKKSARLKNDFYLIFKFMDNIHEYKISHPTHSLEKSC